ncbi:MAG: hypothetical protein IIB87_01275 [Chloroflexi bacterium]|nr:hypothetical protein [Chloroflexota bacterium]
MRLRLFRKNSRHQQLVDLYRGAEEGSPTPDASPSSHQAFEDDQKLIAQLTQLSASAAPSDPSPERGKLLSRVAEMKSAEAAMEAPIMRKILQMRTLAAVGAAVVLVAGAATVGASGGVSDAAGNVGDVLAALNIIDKTPDEADGQIDAIGQPDVAGDHEGGLDTATEQANENAEHGLDHANDAALDGPNNGEAHPADVPLPTQANEHATDGAANADGVELPDQADDHAVDGSENPSLPDAVPDTVDVPLP